MRRRTLLSMVGTAGLAGLAGCGGLLETRQLPSVPAVPENRPDAVYVPSHVEGMVMAGMAVAGPYRAALSYSFPHRFWTVDVDRRNRVEIGDDDEVHLMVNLWDRETGIALPTAGLSIEAVREGETVLERAPWPMLSQNMGFHFGDNVPLPGGSGTYEVTVDVGSMDIRTTGTFDGRFDEQHSLAFTFKYSREERDAIEITNFPQKAGTRGATDPMQMEMSSVGQLPAAENLPGAAVGTGTSGDGRFVVCRLDQPPAGVDGSGPYLAVSARTPYNRYPLPFMGLSASVEGDGETLAEAPLLPTIDPELNYHYGAVLEDVSAGDELALTVGAPPQVSRHEGYETAFLSMEPMRLSLS